MSLFQKKKNVKYPFKLGKPLYRQTLWKPLLLNGIEKPHLNMHFPHKHHGSTCVAIW